MTRRSVVRVVSLFILAAVAAGAAFAGGAGEQTVTRLEVDPQEEVYISPENQDGVQDELIVQFGDVAVAGTDLVIVEYTFSVYNRSGRVVYQQSDVESERRDFFGNLFGGEKPSVEIPETLTWDGTYRNFDESVSGAVEGEFVPSGDYTYQLRIVDDQGGQAQTNAFFVVVDNEAPVIDSVSSEYQIFSPNDDGRRDTVPISQDGSREVTWRGAFLNAAGEEVFAVTWENAQPDSPSRDLSPPDFEWDGTDGSGARVDEGDYTYVLTGTDRAGNSSSSEPITLTLSLVQSTVTVTASSTVFSPNGDGRQDSIDFSLDVSETEGLEEWQLDIVPADDPSNALVSFSGTATVPDSVTFLGEDRFGRTLEDGAYEAVLTAEYINGNRETSDPAAFTVDTQAPQAAFSATIEATAAAVRTQQRVFGGTNKPAVIFDLRVPDPADAALSWTVNVQTEGGLETEFALSDLGLQLSDFPFRWTGQWVDGSQAPDDTYSVGLYGFDPAGNRGETQRIIVRKDTRDTPIEIVLPEQRTFSPGRDGVLDTLEVEFDLAVDDPDSVGEFLFYIRDAGNRVVVSRQITTPLANLVWDGRNNAGLPVPDGDYTMELQVRYLNGNNPVTTAGPVTVDTTAPSGRVAASAGTFGGDEQPDTTITLSSQADEEWTGVIVTPEGRRIEVPLGSAAAAGGSVDFTFDGRAPDGEILDDGVYELFAYATDAVGNRGETNRLRIRKDVPAPMGTLAASPSVFGGTTKPTATITLTSGATEAWTAVFEAESGERFSIDLGATGASGRIEYTWDGTDDTGSPAVDGIYTIFAEATDELGNRGETNSVTLTKETRPTPIALDLSATTISPGIMGRVGSVRIAPVIERVQGLEEFRLEILNAAGAVVQSRVTNRLLNFYDWDGTNAAGRQVPDGNYRPRLTVIYANGNQPSTTAGPIVVDTSLPQLSVTVQAAETAFAPNGDGFRETMRINIAVGLTEGMTEWELRFVHEDGSIKRTLTGRGLVMERFDWDGRGDNGFVTPGNYNAELEVTYRNGETAVGRTESPFLLDNEGPDAAVTISPDPFSPDGNGEDDVTNIRINATDRSRISRWSMEIVDTRGQVFMTYSGTGEPRRTITWDGRSSTGELVQSAEDYTVTLTVEDALRNVSTTSATVSVDILVVQVGDRLRIRLPNIVFAPNTANLFDVEPDQLRQNLQTLRRLAQILNKYPQYEIVVEGHAVRVYWAYPDRGAIEESEVLAPLSEARAQEVRRALIILGVGADRMSAVGKGGTEPVVPHSDLEQRWQNRRVEFWLERDDF